MYYLLEPPAALLWTDTPTDLVEAVSAKGVDLARLDWKVVEEAQAPAREVLRAALAHGIKCGRGLAIHPYVMLDLADPHKRRQLLEEARQMAPQVREMDERTEERMRIMSEISTGAPVEGELGWAKEGRRLEAEVRELMEKGLTESVAKAQKVLAKPVDPDLEAHWRSLGGHPLA